jgi:hypothetical protein
MCLPTKSDEPSSSPAPEARSILDIGGLMLLACLGGPILAGALGGLGAGVVLGAGGVVFALALCAAVPRSPWRFAAAPPAVSRRSSPGASVSLEVDVHAAHAAAGDPKAVVRRLIDEVMNGVRLEVIDELYAPQMAPAARRWIAPFERVDEVYIYRVRDRRITEAWGIEDTRSRQRQLGLIAIAEPGSLRCCFREARATAFMQLVASLSCCKFAAAQVPGGGRFRRRSPPRGRCGHVPRHVPRISSA